MVSVDWCAHGNESESPLVVDDSNTRKRGAVLINSFHAGDYRDLKSNKIEQNKSRIDVVV